MEEEETLSDKRIHIQMYLVFLGLENVEINNILNLIEQQDKEAVKKLKEETDKWFGRDMMFSTKTKRYKENVIDKIFGDKLI